ncbi:hypothetical protein LCGC14_0823400 [marine sediment metagenome]|uniref:Prohead serine protease domain-containing protein n=1 Tax=marine sediment metagenome TaxID=412755 RepID=A0A0F9S311_9ZZZZ
MNEMRHYFGTHSRSHVNSDGSVRFRLTEKKLDRYGEAMLPKGAQLKNYKLNPVVLWAHNWGETQVPIGNVKMPSVEITDDFFDADVKFDDDNDSVDEFAKMISNKVKKDIIRAGSIGFRSIEISKEPIVEGQTSVTHKKWELLEFSIVPIPALPSALAKKEWMNFADECKDFGHPIDEFVDNYYHNKQPTPSNDREYLEKRLEKMANYFDEMEEQFHTLKIMFDGHKPDKLSNEIVKREAKKELESILTNMKLANISNQLRTFKS